MKFVQRLSLSLSVLLFTLMWVIYLGNYHIRLDNGTLQYKRTLGAWMIKLKATSLLTERPVTVRHGRVISNKTVGVYGSNMIGKWYGTFECPKTGGTVFVTQSMDVNVLSKCDALFLIHNAAVPWHKLNSVRPPGQIWIFMSFESVRHTQISSMVHVRSFVNWTFTYFSGSTFPSPYGVFCPFSNRSAHSNSTATEERKNYASSKTGLVCGMVSNCNAQWPRMEKIKEISKYIPTDVYGSCGSMSCPRDKSCLKMLSKYKFYLAFENSLCRDYITEKFWNNALAFDIVPIVYGAPQEDYERSAPPNSFIHVKNFSSIEHLADYLKLLDQNDDLYNKYFEWKRQGYVKPNYLAEHYEPPITMCRILDKLNDLDPVNDMFVTQRNKEDVNIYLNSCK